jgi:MerR family mercuric resistance operon transcriptional regulator
LLSTDRLGRDPDLTPDYGTGVIFSEVDTMMTIGELADAAGVGVETIRFYERKKLIVQPKRPSAGFRRYDEEMARRIRFIRQAQELGFTLAEVKQLLELRLDPARSCADVKSEAQTKIADIDEKIQSLQVMRSALVEITRSCSGDGPTSECPILNAIETAAAKPGRTGIRTSVRPRLQQAKGANSMRKKRQIEVFTAGCGVCEEAVQLVRKIACSSCEVTVHNVAHAHDKAVQEKVKQYGIKRLPSVVVDGKLASCCAVGGVDEHALRALGVGRPIAE